MPTTGRRTSAATRVAPVSAVPPSRPDAAARRGGEPAAGARQLLPAALDTYWQVHREIAEDLHPFGLTTPQYLVLVHLVASRREAGMRQLARAGRHDAATMTAVVDGLYQLPPRRLILRWRRALRTFSGAEQLQLLSLLLRLLEALQETDGQPAGLGLRRLASP